MSSEDAERKQRISKEERRKKVSSIKYHSTFSISPRPDLLFITLHGQRFLLRFFCSFGGISPIRIFGIEFRKKQTNQKRNYFVSIEEKKRWLFLFSFHKWRTCRQAPLEPLERNAP